MDEELERLWIDREFHCLEASFFRHVSFLMGAARDIGFDQPEPQHDGDERDVRVVVDDPSDRMIANTCYLPQNSRLRFDGTSKRLIIGSLFDASDRVSPGARQVAADFFREGLEALYGDGDGRFSVVTGNAADMTGDRVDAESWLRRARQAAAADDHN